MLKFKCNSMEPTLQMGALPYLLYGYIGTLYELIFTMLPPALPPLLTRTHTPPKPSSHPHLIVILLRNSELTSC